MRVCISQGQCAEYASEDDTEPQRKSRRRKREHDGPGLCQSQRFVESRDGLNPIPAGDIHRGVGNELGQ